MTFIIKHEHFHSCNLREQIASSAREAARYTLACMARLWPMSTMDSYYMVDVKSHRIDTECNMPNLTSVERLSRFYEDNKNNFVLLLVEYGINNER